MMSFFTWFGLWMFVCFGVSITVASKVTKKQLGGLYVLAGVLCYLVLEFQ